MSESVVIKSVGQGNPWNDLTFYDVVFDRNGADFAASWGKKGGGDPVPGEQVEGEFFQKDGKWRFRKASTPQGGNSGSSYGGSGGSEYMKPYPPDAVARMGRSHAQEMAVRVLVACPDFNVAPKAQKRTTIKGWTDFFEKDTKDAAAPAQKTATGAGGGTGNGAPSFDPGPAQSPEDDIPFARPEYREPFSERERRSNRP